MKLANELGDGHTFTNVVSMCLKIYIYIYIYDYKNLNLNFFSQVINFISLIDAGDVDGVSKLLSQNVGLNPLEGAIMEMEYIPLFCAVEKGDCEIMELLLKADADPNIQGMMTRGIFIEHLPPLGLAARCAVSYKSYGVFEK